MPKLVYHAWRLGLQGSGSPRPTRRLDIEIGETRLRLNSKSSVWISSEKAPQEVGSIHTVQGYDMNYAGVIIGPDLWFDPVHNRLRINRASYHDKMARRTT